MEKMVINGVEVKGYEGALKRKQDMFRRFLELRELNPDASYNNICGRIAQDFGVTKEWVYRTMKYQLKVENWRV